MAASQANRCDIASVKLQRLLIPIAAATHIYAGIMVARNGSGDLIAGTDATGLSFAGVSEQEVNNTGSAGDKKCEVTPPQELGCIEVDAASPDETWVDKVLCLVDDHTVALASSTTYDIPAGRCVSVEKTGTAGRVIIDTRDRNVKVTA